jgi:hypothetical protein
MAEGLSENDFRRTAMRTLALFLLSILPCSAAVIVPADSQSSVSTDESSVSTNGRFIRVSLVNMSSQPRQVRLKSGAVNLPTGVRVDVDSHVGATLFVVSSTDGSVDERILVKSGDDVSYIRVR